MRCFTLLLSVILLSCGPAQKEEEKDGGLSSEELVNGESGDRIETVKGFTITIPEGWLVYNNYKGTDLTVVSAPDSTGDFTENFNLIVAEDAADISPEDYLAESLAHFKSGSTGFMLLKEGSDKIGGADARWMDYQFSHSGHTIYGRQYYLIKNSKAYVITYSSAAGPDDPNKKVFLTALKTVKLN